MPRFTGRAAATLACGAVMAAGLLATIATPAAAAAQEQQSDAASPAEEPTIIVQGERELETKELRDAIRNVAMRGRRYDVPLDRYQLPLCPRVIGMGDRMGDYVTERIRRNTIDAGFVVDEDESGCVANALLIVVDDQKTLIKRMRQDNPLLFNPRISREIKAAQNRGDAAIVWSTFSLQGPRGRGVASGTTFTSSLQGAFANADGAPAEMTIGAASRFAIAYSLEKMTTILVVDVNRLNGVHLDQLADFATMRILGTPQPRIDLEQDSAASILNLFDLEPAAAPPEMTKLDRAYLKGLYAMRPNDPSTRLEYFVKLAYQDGQRDRPDAPAEAASDAR